MFIQRADEITTASAAGYKRVHEGGSLSPLMGAFMRKSLGVSVPTGCVVIRYRDDWVMLTRSRAPLRRVVQKMYPVLGSLGMRIAVAKTFMGRVARGFDFLGYRFNAHGGGVCAANGTPL